VLKKKITINNKLGMHARAAAQFVRTVTAFSSEVTVRYEKKEASGHSIMGLMMLAASRNVDIEILVSGEDEKKAMDALVKLVSDKFGEKE